jgi:O-antigen/teichoic acid export membrane protein
MSIRRKLMVSSVWSIAATGATLLSSFVVFTVLARLLQPAEFGLVAFVALFVDFARGLMTGGLPEALIQRASWNETMASTAFWANLASSILLAGATAAVGASLIDSGSAVMGEVFVVLGLSLIIDGARSIHEAKLRREFGYKILAIRAVIASLVSGVIGIAMAFYGYGVWALVASRLVATLLQTIVIWHATLWRPRLIFSGKAFHELFGFGVHLLGARLLGHLNGRIPEFVIGFFLGAVALAFYRVGARTLNFLVQSTIQPLQMTALSALSRLPDAHAVGKAYIRLTRATALVSFPVFLGAAAVAPDFMLVCFGEKWTPSAPIMTALALVVAPATLVYFADPALAAVGRTKLIMISAFARVMLSALVALTTVMFGSVAVAAGQTARAHITAPVTLLMLHRGLGLSMKDAVRNLIAPCGSALMMATVVTVLRLTLLSDIAAPMRLGVSVLTGSVLYVGLLLILAPRYTSETLQELLPLLPPILRAGLSKLIRHR